MPTPVKDTVLLALRIMEQIPRAPRRISAKEIQAQLANDPTCPQRDLRSIQRQLQWIADNFPVDVDARDRPYGYGWEKGAQPFSVPFLSVQESLLLVLAQKRLHPLLPVNLMKAMGGFFEQAHRNLAFGGNAVREREWLSKVRVIRETQPLLAPKIKAGIFESVAESLYENVWLEVRYKNADGKRYDVKVMPLGLALQGPRLYLACRFDGYDNERTLALHRLLRAKVTTLPFVRPKDFDLERYDADGRFSFGDGRRIKLQFRIDKKYELQLREMCLADDQVITEKNGRLEVCATVVDSGRLDWWLNGFGEAVDNVRKTAVDENGKSK